MACFQNIIKQKVNPRRHAHETNINERKRSNIIKRNDCYEALIGRAVLVGDIITTYSKALENFESREGLERKGEGTYHIS